MSKTVSNKCQMERLVQIMGENLDIAKGVCRKSLSETRWKAIALELNSLGPPVRTWDKWFRVWTDLKFKTKKKLSHNKAEFKKTGGGPNNIYSFSALEESIISFLCLNAVINPDGDEFGAQENLTVNNQPCPRSSSTPINQTVLMDIDPEANAQIEDVVVEKENRPKHSKENRKGQSSKEDGRIILLEQQTEAQKDFYATIKKEYSDINKTMKSTESYMRKIYYVQKDILELKREKLKVYKEELEAKKRFRKDKLKLKAELLEIKKIILNNRN